MDSYLFAVADKAIVPADLIAAAAASLGVVINVIAGVCAKPVDGLLCCVSADDAASLGASIKVKGTSVKFQS